MVCISCGSLAIRSGVGFGHQPVSTNYLQSLQETASSLHPLNVGQCSKCGLVQLSPPFPAESLTPPYEWIFYKEPEEHLDDMVEAIVELISQKSNPKILGVSYKEESTLQRLEKLGFEGTNTLDLYHDLGALSGSGYPNIESVPALLTAEKALEYVDKFGKSDVVIARHVLEHAVNLQTFLHAMSLLLTDDGVLVIEVPDCEENLARADVSMLWEEHATYFTRRTLRRGIEKAGYTEKKFISYEMNFENCLVSFAQLRSELSSPPSDVDPVEFDEFDRYCIGLQKQKADILSEINGYVVRGEKLAIYGAGHLAETFLNLFELGKYFDCVIDDTPHKQGLFLPGSKLEVCGRDALLSRNISHCVMALSVEVEHKILENNAAFLATGGTFSSCLIASSRYIAADNQETQKI